MVFTDVNYSEEKAASPPAPNSFCVPEGDEDPTEPTYEATDAKHKGMNTYTIEDSDIASESENQPPLEDQSTPLTSPSTNGKASMESKSEDYMKKDQNACHTAEAGDGSQQIPIVLDQEQSSVNASIDSGSAQSDVSSSKNDTCFDYIHDQPFPYIDCDSDGDSLSVELDLCENDERLLGFDLDSESSQESLDESDEDIDSKGLMSKLPSLNYRPPYVEADDDVDDESILSDTSDLKSATEKLKRDLARVLRSPIVDKADRHRLEKATSMLGLERLETLAERSVHDAPSATSRDHMLGEIERILSECCAGSNGMAKSQQSAPQDPALTPSLRSSDMSASRPRPLQPLQRPSSFQSYPLMQSYTGDIPVYGVSHMPYQDGPFTSNEPTVGNLDQAPEQDTGHIRSDHGSAEDNNAGSKKRVSIADIVDSSSAEDQGEKKGTLKRKADEMEVECLTSEPVATNSPSDVSFSQDAQPRTSEGELESSLSQLTELQSIEEQERQAEEPSVVQSGHEEQPPRKRVKTASLASHATTALVGAMVGGLGTIVALACLPPEYFH